MSTLQAVLRKVLGRGFSLIPISPFSLFARLGVGIGSSTTCAGTFCRVMPGC